MEAWMKCCLANGLSNWVTMKAKTFCNYCLMLKLAQKLQGDDGMVAINMGANPI